VKGANIILAFLHLDYQLTKVTNLSQVINLIDHELCEILGMIMRFELWILASCIVVFML
jgi:hypothetical protein